MYIMINLAKIVIISARNIRIILRLFGLLETNKSPYWLHFFVKILVYIRNNTSITIEVKK